MTRTIKAKMAGPPQGRTDGAGIDHDVWVAWLDVGDNDVNVGHTVFPIPNARFAEPLESMPNGERVALYKSHIMEFYGAGATERLIPPDQPVGLDDLSVWDDYLDEVDAYNAELAARTADAESMATAATNWIEGLGSFEGWPFSFVLQEGD